MKFFLLASFALVCTASVVYQTGNIALNEDGSYVIASPYGWQVIIQGPLGPVGQTYYQLFITGPYLPDKTIQLRESSIGPQAIVLGKIFSEYQGVISIPQWQQFLERISSVSPWFYQFLIKLDQQYIQYGQQYYGPYTQQYYGQYTQQYYGPYSLQYQQPYGYQYPSYYSQSSYYPLLSKISGSSYYPGLVANQQYSVPQSFLLKYLGQYQYPYSQYYGQYSGVPQYVQQSQQLSSVGEVQEYPYYGQQYSSLPYYLRQLLGQYGKYYPYYYNQPYYGSYYQNVPQSQLVY